MTKLTCPAPGPTPTRLTTSRVAARTVHPPIAGSTPSVAKALTRVFFVTWAWVIAGTTACAVAVVPIFFFFAAPVGVVVGTAVGPIVAAVVTIGTSRCFIPLRSAPAYIRFTRRTLYGLVLLTIAPAGVGLVLVPLARTVSNAGSDTVGDAAANLARGTAWVLYCLVACLAIARWVGRSLATSYTRSRFTHLELAPPCVSDSWGAPPWG